MTDDVGLTVNGTEVTDFCFGEDWVDSVGDCQHLRDSPLAMTADVVELGSMLGRDTTVGWVASVFTADTRCVSKQCDHSLFAQLDD